MGTEVPLHEFGGETTTFRSWFFPSIMGSRNRTQVTRFALQELFSSVLYHFSGPSARNIENIFRMLAVMSIAARERLS